MKKIFLTAIFLLSVAGVIASAADKSNKQEVKTEKNNKTEKKKMEQII